MKDNLKVKMGHRTILNCCLARSRPVKKRLLISSWTSDTYLGSFWRWRVFAYFFHDPVDDLTRSSATTEVLGAGWSSSARLEPSEGWIALYVVLARNNIVAWSIKSSQLNVNILQK